MEYDMPGSRFLVFLTLFFALLGPSVAGQFADGDAAFKHKDYASALHIWQPLAEVGDTDAQYGLGLLYSSGLGLPQDYAEAAKWYRKSAKQGNGRAATNLGQLYTYGQGVRQDDLEAVAWYRKAASQGIGLAEYDLGLAYFSGRGVQKDA